MPARSPMSIALAGLQATGADVSVEDLSKPELVKRVNDWVAARTNGLIPSILDQPPGRAGLVALNALYFKDRWQTPFDAKATDTAPFHAVGGRSIDVPMMHSTVRQLLFRQDDRFVAVDLPYATAGFSLVVVATKAGPARVTDFADAAGWLSGASFEPSEGQVALPRFSLRSSADLLGALDALGLKRARLSPAAFAGLSPVPQVIAQVLQRTVIKVDEEGTEAAAATAAVTKRSFTADFVKMTVDKPFLFALRDQTSGLILLAGYVGDPTGGNESRGKRNGPRALRCRGGVRTDLNRGGDCPQFTGPIRGRTQCGFPSRRIAAGASHDVEAAGRPGARQRGALRRAIPAFSKA